MMPRTRFAQELLERKGTMVEGKNKRRTLGRWSRRGFTLVELLVAMVVSSAVIAAAYQLFSSTSAAMYEVDSLSGTTDKARFGLEMLARDLQSAGANATHDALDDTLVHPDFRVNNFAIRGIYDFAQTPDERQLSPLQSIYNQATFSDELIVLGSFDYPFDVEVTFPPPTGQSALIPNNTKLGAPRFSQLDPFVSDDVPVELPGPIADSVRLNMENRLLRVLDRNGYAQFIEITGSAYQAGATGGISLTLGTNGLVHTEKEGQEDWGIEPADEGDAGYQAALIDVYRYRVCIDRLDPQNLRLVRERLNAALLARGNRPPLPDVCDSANIGVGQFIVSQETVVDRVVDFRVWYDCADPAGVQRPRWNTGWMPPGEADAGHNCAYLTPAGAPVVAGNGPSNIRVAHVRLSVRTDRERIDVDNYGFLGADGNVYNVTRDGLTNTLADIDNPGNNIVGGLQTFDIDGDPSTAARVVTLQLDVNLPNFGNRARIQRAEAGDFGL